MKRVRKIGEKYAEEKLDELMKDYTVVKIDEYFKILDRESLKRSKMVAKSLTEYLKKIEKKSKFDCLKKSSITM